ncbi:hypothetical protein GQ600_25877 [Phytophthora cactorum]|nr:hypothetical protein GQ600_25877 [Phytophthora cactorum]
MTSRLWPHLHLKAQAHSVTHLKHSAKKLSFAEKHSRNAGCKIGNNQGTGYELVHYIPPTSNVAERFFYPGWNGVAPLRQAMAPTQLENILFLKMNRRFWNMAMVQRR